MDKMWKQQELEIEDNIRIHEYLLKGDNLNTEDMIDILYDHNLISIEVMKAITCIYGSNKETYENMLYYATGYRTFQQYLEAFIQ